MNELIIFEWEKNFNEIGINIRPNFNIETVVPQFKEKDLFSKDKISITNYIYYYEIPYRGGVFIIIVNEGFNEFMINVEFEKLHNLFILKNEKIGMENNLNHIELFLKSRSKEYINLKTKNNKYNDEIAYKINFQLKRVKKDLMNKSTNDKIY